MKMILAKAFKSADNQHVTAVPYIPDNYYAFVKKYIEQGMQQAIITSEVMIELMKYYFLERNGKITKIELLHEGSDLSQEVDCLLEKTLNDRAYWGELEKRLEFLNEQTSIDIKKVEIKVSSREDASFLMFMQLNGVFGISDKCFDEENLNFTNKLERCLNS